ncbi:hypothetical protein [Pseudomonas sp. CHM02]|uniref:hypothetical protein n=1 Tax=Pseudomonas sp. CHM02 TaxID=1463662 RepID=UPI0012DC5884|nr:hypothetical protein [Pseudomonas sp. CHM02]
MTERFPTIDEARNWYFVSLDGLRHLKRIADGANSQHISKETLDQIMFMSEREWKDFVRRKEDEHEAFASLALLAACEGGIRRDCAWRSAEGNSASSHYQRFQRLNRNDGHISFASIIDAWQAALGRDSYFKNYLFDLRDLYVNRNALAHGRASLQQFNFALIYERLDKVRKKWRQTTSDFKGF